MRTWPLLSPLLLLTFLLASSNTSMKGASAMSTSAGHGTAHRGARHVDKEGCPVRGKTEGTMDKEEDAIFLRLPKNGDYRSWRKCSLIAVHESLELHHSWSNWVKNIVRSRNPREAQPYFRFRKEDGPARDDNRAHVTGYGYWKPNGASSSTKVNAVYWRKGTLYKKHFNTKELFWNHVEAHARAYEINHRNILPILDVITEDPYHYIVLTKSEDSGSLQNLCQETRHRAAKKSTFQGLYKMVRHKVAQRSTDIHHCKPKHLFKSMEPIAKALKDMFEKHIYHRNVTPQSIKVSLEIDPYDIENESIELYLSDFSFAKYNPEKDKDKAFQHVDISNYYSEELDWVEFVDEGWWKVQDSLAFAMTLWKMVDEHWLTSQDSSSTLNHPPQIAADRRGTNGGPIHAGDFKSEPVEKLIGRITQSIYVKDEALTTFTPDILYRDFYVLENYRDYTYIYALDTTSRSRHDGYGTHHMGAGQMALAIVAAVVGAASLIKGKRYN
ncbi:hypothetical protein BJ684DRAFT_15471 [Piptocephalis cylindrospora]|uniref:Protein kinase domain-containing protein n=1 Tax=Piptocephalis cylindrospora TaxID=1907219 RepID=A0A4P9Y891_9FUNG|nr:hypothetical protein BJ684DRAFT_15471 [Piptocephalis cylindrospora]|eukprot:RKP14190.1 hypothetical protein BJ684DRAFT_15471 [Piptocephalis cylindrospora]